MSGNSALLAQIQQGKKLKKAETNDRSAPLVDGSKPSGGGGGVTRPGVASAPVPGAGGPPQLGALFAGGIPKLKPAGQAPTGPLGKPPSIPNRGKNGYSTPGSPATPSRSAPPLSSTREFPSRVAPTPPPVAAAPSVPTPPRRPPPPARPASPPSRRPPPPTRPASPPSRPPVLPARSISPPPRPTSSGPAVTPFRQIPTPPTSSQSLSLPARKVPPPPTTSGRAPPPPPPRPSSTIKTGTTSGASSQPARAVPPPPSRRNTQSYSEAETSPSQPARAVPSLPSRRNPQPYSEKETPSQPARIIPPPPSRRNPQPDLEEETAPSQPARAFPPPPPPPPPSRRNPQPTLEEESAPPQPVRGIPRPPSRRIPQQASEDEPAMIRARALSTGGSGVNLPLRGPSASKSTLVPPVSRPPPGAPPLGMRGASPGRRTVSVSNLNGSGHNGIKPVSSSRFPSPPPSSGSHTFPTSSDFPPPRKFTRSAKKYESGNVRGSGFDVSVLG